ncbi:predicted protein [Uncinocarpus reesii 1704]|uniref:Uncharacterized protein n=1 Tax=Uncinocarpus reesii (strain UAMH 1704) TaxID=336963 RepID=C4JX00_UNCRE|nr:uncharacterized protein UREG_06173 [Uncinocarpus reesii 1704]EEP81308.1 predicted protein [Uncinocarpus reesii 1704]
MSGGLALQTTGVQKHKHRGAIFGSIVARTCISIIPAITATRGATGETLDVEMPFLIRVGKWAAGRDKAIGPSTIVQGGDSVNVREI